MSQISQSTFLNATKLRSVGTPTTKAVFMSNLRNLGLSAPSELPDTWDWRDNVTLCKVGSQGSCGCCWAFSSTQAFADRWRIATNKSTIDGKELNFNILTTIACTDKNLPNSQENNGNGCAGSYPENCQEFFSTKGAVLSEPNSTCLTWNEYCQQVGGNCCPCQGTDIIDKETEYPNIECSDLNECDFKFKSKPGDAITDTVLVDPNSLEVDHDTTIHNIKTSIITYGPVVTKYIVYSDFMDPESNGKWPSTNGVYIHGRYGPATNSGGHAVVIVGWGKTMVPNEEGQSEEIEYWIVRNSWGTDWGFDGYFKFAVNNNGENAECGMDIPFVQPGTTYLMGGTVSFIPDYTPTTPDLDDPSSPKDLKLLWIILSVIGGLLIIFLIYIMYIMYKTTKKNSHSLPYSSIEFI